MIGSPLLILYSSQLSPTTNAKNTLTHTVTGHYISKEVKGHSIWQHSIAHSCEMNHDRHKIVN